MRQNRQCLDHARREPGLRKGLPAPQWQRDLPAGKAGKAVRNENLARDNFKRPQKVKVLDAARSAMRNAALFWASSAASSFSAGEGSSRVIGRSAWASEWPAQAARELPRRSNRA